MAVKAFELPENGDGVRFYEFKNIVDPIEFKNMYRMKLDGLKIDQEAADKLVEEAKVAFCLNINLFKELDRLAGFEEDIVHEEVETIPTSKRQRDESTSQSTTGKLQHETNEDGVDWLKAVAAIVIVVAVLIAIALKLGKQV